MLEGKGFFGICVGMQALFEGSEEAEGEGGMGMVKGRLKRFDGVGRGGRGRKAVPCIGWNDATTQFHSSSSSTSDSQPQAHSTSNDTHRSSFYGLADESKYYYVHSYFAPYTPQTSHALEQAGWTVATATYGDETYIGALGRGNIFATQFHPEKSGEAGLRVIRAFLEGRKYGEVSSSRIIPTAVSMEGDVNGDATVKEVDEGTNGLTRRIIACLDVRTNDSGDLVVTKGDQYDVREKSNGSGVRNLGKPVTLAKKYYAQGADEITFLNITSFRELPLSDLPMLEILRRTSEEVFVPLTIGGGIRDMLDPGTGKTVSALEVARRYFESGADKVSIGSDAVFVAEEWWAHGGKGDGKSGIERISEAYGRQAVVVSVDPKRVYVSGVEDEGFKGKGFSVIRTAERDGEGREFVYFACTVKGGRETRDLDVVQLVKAVEALGAGEILLNSIDRDGSNRGYDLELIRLVKENVSIPVIASSGAGKPEHFEEVFRETDVDAALGAGMFHRGEWTVGEVKGELEGMGMLVRPFEEFSTDA